MSFLFAAIFMLKMPEGHCVFLVFLSQRKLINMHFERAVDLVKSNIVSGVLTLLLGPTVHL